MQNVIIFILIIFFIWLIFLTLNIFRFYRKHNLVQTAASAGELPELITDYGRKIQRILGEVEDIKTASEALRAQLAGTVQKVGVVRFDAYEEAGGKISYSVALLNEKADGVVITTLNGRTDCRSYAKPVINGGSPYALSGEEKEAIQQAFSSRSE